MFHSWYHLASRLWRALKQDTIISLASLTGAIRRKILSLSAVPRALRGPFNNMPSARLSATQTLCKRTLCFYLRFIGFSYELMATISPALSFVNKNAQIFPGFFHFF